MPRNAQHTILGRLQQLNAALTANSAELSNLESQRQQFGYMVGRTLEVFTRQAALTAQKQETSQELQDLLTESSRLATVLRLAVKAHYGIRAEKLVEFEMQPFRGRKLARLVPPPAGGSNPDPETPPSIE
jgi:vacuolar-type H+-ATPase subunit I/STV1